jgi:hypothetical protein
MRINKMDMMNMLVPAMVARDFSGFNPRLAI